VPCRVRTLADLLQTHGIGKVALLKVDVEGDELEVLRGLGQRLDHVQQVVMEVHDIYGRLWRALCLLRRHGFRAVAVPQRTSTVLGYRMVIPPSLRLWYVYARRKPRRSRRSRRKRGN